MITLFKVYKDDCGPCKMLNPVVERILAENSDVKFETLNAKDYPKTCETLGITTVPVVLVELDGVEVGRVNGLRRQREYQALIDKAREQVCNV